MEYSALGDIVGGIPFDMSQMRVNPFDHRLCKTYSNLLAMAIMLASFSPTDVLDVRKKRALRVAVFRMYKMHTSLWSPRVLLQCVRTFNDEDITLYNEEGVRQLKEEHEGRKVRLFKSGMSKDDLGLVNTQFENLVERRVTLSPDDTKAAANPLFDLLDDVFSGEDSELFGDNHSMFDMMSQRAVVKKWIGFTTQRGEDMMRTLDALLKTYAIENHQFDLLAHLELDDERHKSISNPTNALTSEYFSKIARSLPIINFSSTQRFPDMRKGEQGSPQYRAGENIINDMGGVIVARQNNSKEILDEFQEKYSLLSPHRDLLPRLPRYCVMIKLGEEFHPTFMRVFATELEMPIIRSDRATESLLLRPDITNAEDLELYAHAHGVKFLGAAV